MKEITNVSMCWGEAKILLSLYDENISEIQRVEMRKAFYAGYGFCLRKLLDLPTDDELTAVKIMHDWAREVDDFFKVEVDEWNSQNLD